VTELCSIVSIASGRTISWNTYVGRQDDRRWWLIQIANVEWLALHADVGRNQRVQPLGGLRDRRLGLLRRLSSHSHLRKLLGHALDAGLDGCGLLGVSRVSRVVARLAVCRRLAICRLLLRRRRVYVAWLTVCWLLGHTVGGLCWLTWVSKCACGWCWLTAWRGGGGQASICARTKVECLTGVCSLLLTASCWCLGLLLCAILLLAVLLAVLVRVGHLEVPRAWPAFTRDLYREFC
jgi:hypothetical protein